MDEIKGKWQVFLVDSCGEKHEAISVTTDFCGAMACVRGFLQRCEYGDFVGGMMPVPFLVDLGQVASQVAAQVATSSPLTHLVKPFINMERANKELDEAAATASATSNY